MRSALIAALVAAFVTLAIEYLAKPALDARKALILRASEARRRLFGLIKRIEFMRGQMVPYRSEPDLLQRIPQLVDDLDALVTDVLQLLTSGDPQVPDEVETVVLGYTAGVTVEALLWRRSATGHEPPDEDPDTEEAADILVEYSDLSPLRLRQRRAIRRSLRSMADGWNPS